ncbi:unnamed protein product, partial [Cladocopium goreaui]
QVQNKDSKQRHKTNMVKQLRRRTEQLSLQPGTALLVVVGRHRQREMEQSLDVEPVHVYQHTWEETVNHAEAQGVKYMFVAMTPQEYSAQSIDDGTLPAVQHIHHNTGFTSWHGSFHDAVTYLLWCIATGFLSLMYQGEPAYMFDTTEHGSQRVLRIRAKWMQILERYSFTNWYAWTQHVPLNVRTVINRPVTDPQHAGPSMSLYHSGTAVARHMGDDLQRALLHYTAQFTAQVQEQFNEAENLGSQQMRDKVAAMRTWTLAGLI